LRLSLTFIVGACPLPWDQRYPAASAADARDLSLLRR